MKPVNTLKGEQSELSEDYDFEMRSAETEYATAKPFAFLPHFKFIIAGIFFGILLVKSEVISWFRIQEMFRLQSFHMYGVIGSAVISGMIAIWLIKKFNIKTISGGKISLPEKKFNKGQIYGGLLFGFGWALTGACPGPLFAQIGTGVSVIVITLLSAIAGTWVYGYLSERLPH